MKRLLALAAFQIVAILAWASYHEYVWATAPTFRIPLRPRDPFDLIRGRYFVLNPQDSSIAAGSGVLASAEIARLLGPANFFTGTIQVGFCPVGTVYRVCALVLPGEKTTAAARFWCKAFATLTRQERGWALELDLGLRRFFIPNRLQLPAGENREGWELEVSYRPGLTPLPRRLFFKETPIDLK
jgi:hypothetical protein